MDLFSCLKTIIPEAFLEGKLAKMEGVRGRKFLPASEIKKRPAPPPARILEGRDPQKNVLILLEEKSSAQIQKFGEHFSTGHASFASGGGAASFSHEFLIKWVRVKS